MNTVLYSALFLIAAWLVFQRIRNRNVRHITPSEVKKMTINGKNARFLDVRTDRETRGKKMKGAVCIPLHDLRERLQELENMRESEIIVYCATGTRSITAARILAANGFSAFSMRGGLVGWRD